MFIRVWRTGIAEGRLDELKSFAAEVSAPMFRQLEGCAGYMYAHDGAQWITYSLWESLAHIEAAEQSSIYRETVERIMAIGVLADAQSTEIFELVDDIRFS